MNQTLFKFCALVAMGFLIQTQSTAPSDFAALQKLSIEELHQKTEAHKKAWGLDKILGWSLSQDSGKLVLPLPDGLTAVSPAQIIGTYNSEDRTWLWAWANSSIDEKLQLDARKVQKYGQEHQIDRLTRSKWVGTEVEAWEMVALAVKLCNEQGAYRGPAGATKVFIAFGEVTLSRK